MGKFKEIISEEKKNMPDYQYKFLYHQAAGKMHAKA